MTDTSKVLRFLERAAARAELGDPDVPQEDETITYTREQLREAVAYAHAGSQVPPDARMRSVKKAVVSGMRPVTSYQSRFNEHLLSAADGLAATAEALRNHLALQDQRLARFQAGIASADLTLDDFNDDLRRLADKIDGLGDSIDSLRVELAALRTAELAELRSEVSELRARQDVILRAARASLPEGATEHLQELNGVLTTEQALLRTRLDHAVRPPRDQVMWALKPYLSDLATAAVSGHVIDVGAGRGEWLELLRTEGIDAYGLDPDPDAAAEAAARGLDIRAEDAIDHLQALPAGSVRAITAFRLVDRLPLDTLVALLDAALVALAPGGLLLLVAANPTNLTVGASTFWLDPAGYRPTHPRLLEVLLLERGFASAEIRFDRMPDGPEFHTDDLVTADDDPVRARALIDRLNWTLGGPLDVAVLARKATPAGS